MKRRGGEGVIQSGATVLGGGMNLRESIRQLDAADAEGALTLATEAEDKTAAKTIIFLWMRRLGGNASELIAAIDRRNRDPEVRELLSVFADSRADNMPAEMALADAAGLPWGPGQQALFDEEIAESGVELFKVGDRVEATERWGVYVQRGDKGTVILNESAVEFNIIWDLSKSFIDRELRKRFIDRKLQTGVKGPLRSVSAVERLGEICGGGQR